MDGQFPRSLHSKYGGVHFTQLATAHEINEFVRSLSSDQKDNLFEVMQALNQRGYIRIENDHKWMDPSGEIHPD